MSDEQVTGTQFTEPPVRINAKQSSKGDWQLEATARGDSTEAVVAMLDEAITVAERRWTAAGRRLAGS